MTELSPREVIGTQAPDDFFLDPEAHAARLPPEAGALVQILSSGEIAALIAKFREADARAVGYQGRYKRLGYTAISLHAAGAILGAAVILPEVASPGGPWSDVATIAEFVSILIAIGAGFLVGALNVFKRWNEERAVAEVTRIELFKRLVTASAPALQGELPLLSLQLEYFRRYQLQVQQAYYRTRGAQHRRRHNLQRAWIFLSGVITIYLLVTSANRIGQLGLPLDSIGNEYAVFFGVVVASLTAAMGSFSLLGQHESNAKRYATTYANLEKIESSYLEAAREAAVAGNQEGVISFVDAVNDLVSLEHRQWIYLQEMAAQPEIAPLRGIRLPKLSLGPRKPDHAAHARQRRKAYPFAVRSRANQNRERG